MYMENIKDLAKEFYGEIYLCYWMKNAVNILPNCAAPLEQGELETSWNAFK